MNFDKVLELYGLPGFILVLCAFALYQRYQSRTKVEEARSLEEVNEDQTDEKLDQQTRDITNKLALKAFDIQERLQRLQAEYVEQGTLVKTQAAEIARLTTLLANKDIAIDDYRKQITELVNEVSNSAARIKQLETDIAILESIRD